MEKIINKKVFRNENLVVFDLENGDSVAYTIDEQNRLNSGTSIPSSSIDGRLYKPVFQDDTKLVGFSSIAEPELSKE